MWSISDVFLCPLVGTDSYPFKVHDSVSWDGTALHSFVKRPNSLPNLHSLEIRCSEYDYIPAPLETELKGIKLPPIRTLILPLTGHPLLQHCCDVEDVVLAVEHGITYADG